MTASTAHSTLDAEFTDFVERCAPGLLRTARMLGADDQRADDLVQATLVKTYLAWPRARATDPEAYARRVLANHRIDTWRARRREVLTDPTELPRVAEPRAAGPGGHADPVGAATADRDEVLGALLTLTERQRRIVVLRHVLGLSDAEVAADLGVSVGTVKSTASRALAQLRVTLAVGRADGAADADALLATAAAAPPAATGALAPAVAARARAVRRRRRALVAGAAALAVVLGAAAGGDRLGWWDGAADTSHAADYPAYADVTALAAAADVVVEGTVLDARTEDVDIDLGPATQLEPFEVYRVRVARAYQGDAAPGAVVEVAASLRDGPEPDTRLEVGGAYVLFLGESFDGRPRHPLNPEQAVYRVTADGSVVPLVDGPFALAVTRAYLEALTP